VPPDNPKAELLIMPGTLVEVRLPGGGGYGRPDDRDPDLIAADALEDDAVRTQPMT
jgi:N-methylhydantoinase B/oxoprolinase/acetone carboxylase alpha subunit